MPRPSLHPDVALDVRLSATMHRNRYAQDPAPVIAELDRIAGRRRVVLTSTAASWAAWFRDEHTATLCDALEQIPGVAGHPAAADAARRRGAR